jgi:hypothetical protein
MFRGGAIRNSLKIIRTIKSVLIGDASAPADEFRLKIRGLALDCRTGQPLLEAHACLA